VLRAAHLASLAQSTCTPRGDLANSAAATTMRSTRRCGFPRRAT